MAITIKIPGVPVAKGRPRMTRSGHVYTPKKTLDAEYILAQAWRISGYPKFQGPVKVRMLFRMPIPKSWSRKRREAAVGVWHTKRPDIDNLIKIIDGLNELAWDDDSQIVVIEAIKIYEIEPETVIEVSEI